MATSVNLPLLAQAPGAAVLGSAEEGVSGAAPHAQEGWQLRALGLLDPVPDERFDRIARLARRLFDVPIAMVGFRDGDQVRYKSRIGLDVLHLPLDRSFCGHVMRHNGTLLVCDSATDPRWDGQLLVNGAARIRFYAGVPVRLRGGAVVGTLCVMDAWPRLFPAVDLTILSDLAGLVERELNATGATLVDEDTGLANSEAFGAMARKALSICERSRLPAALLKVELMEPETSQRASAADQVQSSRQVHAELARLLSMASRGSDVLARIGKDTFALLATDCAPADLERVAARLQEAVTCRNVTLPPGTSPLRVHCSVHEASLQLVNGLSGWVGSAADERYSASAVASPPVPLHV
jgi:GGDEF domain-containing protein